MNHMNNIHKYLELKIAEEENNNINYLEKNISAFIGTNNK